MSNRKQRRGKPRRVPHRQREQKGYLQSAGKPGTLNTGVRSSGPFRYWVLVCLLAGLIVRLAIAWQGDFIFHPDEVFQYLEQGHRAVFGYGIVPWEYRYGSRSWLVPGFIAAWLWVGKFVGLNTPAFYINAIKAVFCVVSLAIPIGMYLYARRHFSETAALLALIFGCFWYELAVFAHKPLTTLVATVFLMMYLGLDDRNTGLTSVWVLGTLGVLTLMIRLQLTPVASFLMLLSFYRFSVKQRIHFVSAASVTLIACGLLDYLTWGGWWHSIFESIYLNFSVRLSTAFSVSPSYTYLYQLLLTTGGLFYITTGFAFANPSRYWTLFACLLLIIFPHSMIAHKEYRFILAISPIWLLLAADLITRVRAVWLRTAFSGAMGLVSLSGLLFLLPLQATVYGVELAKFSFLKPQDHLRAYRELSKDDNAKGVLDVTRAWGSSGGYYYLHRKIPLYHLAMFKAFLKDKSLNQYVSHIITTANVLGVPGFTEQKRIGDLIVWQRNQPTQPQKTWRSYQITYHQAGVDDVLGEPIKPEHKIILVEPK